MGLMNSNQLSTTSKPLLGFHRHFSGLTSLIVVSVTCFSQFTPGSLQAQNLSDLDQTITCDVLVIGGGLSGVGASYEALLRGKAVCLTEITDWVGGQISSQGTSALDETVNQRKLRFFPRGYLQFRDEILRRTGRSRPGDCWVSEVCFSPQMGHQILLDMLSSAEKQGKGTLHWLPNTVIKNLEISESPNSSGKIVQSALAIQHSPQPNASHINTLPLSQTIEDSYGIEDSKNFKKRLIQLQPTQNWMVIEATETGEILALADVPYQVGVDGQSYQNPSASSDSDYPYCTQAITYTFAMEATQEAQIHERPPFFSQFEPFYSFDQDRYAEAPNLVFSYRRIFSAVEGVDFRSVNPGDISMQNWGGGNDYGPGNESDNLILTRSQLLSSGQLRPGEWRGGLRPSSLEQAERLALGYFYWWAQGTTDSKLANANKQPLPNVKLLQGLQSPMGTSHGLSKYPYIRESRRLIGRPDYAYPNGFQINEIDVSRQDYRSDYYQQNLSSDRYRALITATAGLKTLDVITGQTALAEVQLRARSRLFPDSVGIGHYPIDFHPCMLESPPEKPGNIERPIERQGAARTYPYQIPLRAMIPQEIDNLIVTGKSIATSHISSATYRVHSFEWSAGAAAGTTATFALENELYPYQLIENMPRNNDALRALQKQLNQNQNPTAFPGMSIFNESWQDW